MDKNELTLGTCSDKQLNRAIRDNGTAMVLFFRYSGASGGKRKKTLKKRRTKKTKRAKKSLRRKGSKYQHHLLRF
jgi:hypothetical protein